MSDNEITNPLYDRFEEAVTGAGHPEEGAVSAS